MEIERLYYGTGHLLGYHKDTKTFHEESSTLFGSLAECLKKFGGKAVPDVVEIEIMITGHVKTFRLHHTTKTRCGEDIASYVYHSDASKDCAEAEFKLEVWND